MLLEKHGLGHTQVAIAFAKVNQTFLLWFTNYHIFVEQLEAIRGKHFLMGTSKNLTEMG